MLIKKDAEFGLSSEDVSRIQNILATCPGIKEGYIFGSRAMGTHRPGSDIDIALSGEDLTFQDKLTILRLLDDRNVPHSFDLILLNRTDKEDLISHVRRVGKVIYEV